MTFVPDVTAILIIHVTALAADDDVVGAADDSRAAGLRIWIRLQNPKYGCCDNKGK